MNYPKTGKLADLITEDYLRQFGNGEKKLLKFDDAKKAALNYMRRRADVSSVEMVCCSECNALFVNVMRFDRNGNWSTVLILGNVEDLPR